MGSRPTALSSCPTRWSPMSGPIASPRGRSERLRRLAPAVALLLVALLAGLSVGSSWFVARHLRAQAVAASEIYSVAYRGLIDPDPASATAALVEVGIRVRRLGLPLVLTDTAGRVTATANVSAADTAGRMGAYIAELDAESAPFVTPGVGAVHFGRI